MTEREILTLIIGVLEILFIIWTIVNIKKNKNRINEIENIYEQKIKHLWNKIDELKKNKNTPE